VGSLNVGCGRRSSADSETRNGSGLAQVDIFLYQHMILGMARAATTTDAFNAIAEPQRRRVLMLLKGEGLPAGDVAKQLGLSQSATSKHLRVLREVGLVYAHRDGKRRVYGLDARGLRPIHEWTGGFESFWSETLGRLDEYVRGLQRKEESDAN